MIGGFIPCFEWLFPNDAGSDCLMERFSQVALEPDAELATDHKPCWSLPKFLGPLLLLERMTLQSAWPTHIHTHRYVCIYIYIYVYI